MSDRSLVDYQVEDHIAIVAMNNPGRGNSYTIEMSARRDPKFPGRVPDDLPTWLPRLS
ncbi:hypothetical protein [Nocardia sp. bgisy134]|uniref:hypothetical protein n=1 Tax=Nocardia sp. bgisy134 TaxID=3413789 RepID=UPI003D71F2DC